MVAAVHSETSSGMINAVADIGAAVRALRPAASFFVDAMSSFGGMPLDLKACSYAIQPLGLWLPW
jgi:aspartate aminotransferase-like enzyme